MKMLIAASMLVFIVVQNLPAAQKAGALSPDQAKQADALADKFADRLHRVRYMESGTGRPVKVAGWEGFPTRQYTYTVSDKDGTTKSADVILLDPTANQISRWIVSALIEVKGHYDPAEGERFFREVLGQSGGQFPVAGVVYEDILPADGKYEIYCFRDGVTVKVAGVEHRSTTPMTSAQRQASIDGKVTYVFTYARIASTTPQQFIAAGGNKDVLNDGKSTQAWLDAVRSAYQAAWTSDRNELFVDWARANMK